MNNGIVLKVNRSSVVVLTANGEYLKCKKLLSSYSVGEEIQFPSNAIILNKKVKISIPKLIPVVIACGLILFSFTFVNLNDEEAFAEAGKVRIDSEAKVSLTLDKQLKVISLKGHNEQGKKVIDKMDNWQHKSLNSVMNDIVGEMEKSKVIEPDEKIKLTGKMNKEFKDKQSELNHELKDIQDSNNHFIIPNAKDLDQPKVKNQNQSHSQNPNKQENGLNSHKVTSGDNNYKVKSNFKSPTVEKNNVNDNGHSKEVKNNRHQEEHWGNKQSQSNHRHQEEEHKELTKQNQKKQNNNNEKHQVKKKNDYNDDSELRRSNNVQRRNENNEGCHGCNNRYKNNQNKNDNGWQNGDEKHSD
ncbi:anti-sigma factor domain-containing protein [Gottfriedia sp. NPDC057948]|uniref:anti-sigma factor domain-containing protein n=1 Tax=Gottfriedia sp. NPDC057948 TaxID=3346287 RepID=UPI0036DCB7BF